MFKNGNVSLNCCGSMCFHLKSFTVQQTRLFEYREYLRGYLTFYINFKNEKINNLWLKKTEKKPIFKY